MDEGEIFALLGHNGVIYFVFFEILSHFIFLIKYTFLSPVTLGAGKTTTVSILTVMFTYYVLWPQHSFSKYHHLDSRYFEMLTLFFLNYAYDFSYTRH